MPYPQALQSLEIYKTFVKQTEIVLGFLETGKKLQKLLSIDIPTLKTVFFIFWR